MAIQIKTQDYDISYSRTETASSTVTNRIKLGGSNVNNVYLGTNQVKAIYLGDNLIQGTTYYDANVEYTLSIAINNGGSSSTEAKYNAYSYIASPFQFGDDPVETTINTYMHSTYSYIRYYITHSRNNFTTGSITYSATKGRVILISNLPGRRTLRVFNGFYQIVDNNGNPLPFAQFSVYTAYQKINCNVWKSNWYPATEEPTEEPTSTSATITLKRSISGDFVWGSVTMQLNSGGSFRKSITSDTVEVTFDNLTNGQINYIYLSNFTCGESGNGGGAGLGTGQYNLTANGNIPLETNGPTSSNLLEGTLTLDCRGNYNKTFATTLRIVKTSSD